MKKIIEYVMIGAFGLLAGIIISVVACKTDKSSASGLEEYYDIEKDYDEKKLTDSMKSLFDEEHYVYMENNAGVQKIRRNDIMEDIEDEYSIYESSEKEILSEIVGMKYDIRMIEENEIGRTYAEYKDDYQTGASASFEYDENGKLRELLFRTGLDYDVSDAEMIGEEKALEIAREYVEKEYPDNGSKEITEITLDQIYCKPNVGNCYRVKVTVNHGEDITYEYGIVINVRTAEIEEIYVPL